MPASLHHQNPQPTTGLEGGGVKPHFVVKMRSQLDAGNAVPHWVEFISDKSRVRERANREIDALFSSQSLKYWLTKEYIPAALVPTEDELALGLERTYRLILQEDYDYAPSLLESLRLLPSVEAARRIEVAEASLPQTKSIATSLSGAQGTHDLIGLSYARAVTRGVPEVKIAVLDTGADLGHPELQGKLAERADFVNLDGLDTSGFIGDFIGYDNVPDDEVGHGTHVSGIVAGRGLKMDEGVAPECTLMPVRVLATMQSNGHKVGAGVVDNINTGIKWAVDHGARVINMSLGIKHQEGGLPHEDVVQYALRKNVSVVAASGNDGSNERYYPGALRGVFAIGAVDEDGNVAGFSSYGANIFVVAPGTRILSAFANGNYATASGTSQAAPFVAGAFGLFKSYALELGVNLTNNDLAYVLKHTSDKVDSRLRDAQAGFGLLNLTDAFKLLDRMLS